jgi:hypothetical protein
VSTIPPIQVKIEADTTGLKSGLSQAQQGIKQVDDGVKTASTGMKSFGDNIKKVGAALGVAFAGAQVVNFAKESIMAASNMEESLSKVNVVFGESAKSVIAFSSTAAEKMGISSQAALEAAGTYGNLFQALGVTRDKATEMSTGLVSLAADLGSFNNMSVTDSLNALRSGLSGETEPLKRFGIALNEVTLKNKAMAMGFGEIKGVMDPAIKAQVTYALVLEQTKLAQGDYARTADGTANTMKTLQAKFEDAKVAVGEALMPAFRALLGVLNLAIPVLTKIGEFFKNNQAEVKAFAITVGVLGLAWAAYTVYLKAAIIQQKILNFVQKLNPLGAIIIAIGLLVAAMVKLWNSNESFRKAVVAMAKVALQAFASIIPMVGQVFESIIKVTSGPLRLLLLALSKLPGVGKYAKAGLDIMNKGIEGISGFAQSAANKASILASKLDDVAAKAGKAAKATKDGVKDVTTGATDDPKTTNKVTAAQQKELDKLKEHKEKVQDIYDDMNEAIADAKDKAAEALVNRDEKIADARARALEQEADLRERFDEQMADALERHTEAVANAKERRREADEEANKRYNERIFEIDKQYAEKTLDLTKALNEKMASLKAAAAEKTIELNQKAEEKRLEIIKKSEDRLRDAFAKGTTFDLQASFKTGGSADALLKDLKSKLEAARELQKNAAVLAGMGYSQTFIEEVVKNGPEAGNKIAEALKAASPEATAELQSLYGEVQNVSDNGLNQLAQTMNAGANLATEELRNAYAQVAKDLQESLTEVDKKLKEGLAEANKVYTEAMTEAAKVRDENKAEAAKQLKEALAESLKRMNEDIAEADKVLKKAQEDAQKALEKGLADVQKSLQKALADAQKDYEKAIDEINKSTTKKIEDLKKKLAEVIALIAAINAAQAAAAAASAPKYTPITTTTTTPTTTTPTTTTPTTTTNITQNFTTTKVDPYDVKLATLAGVIYGEAVTLPTGGGSGGGKYSQVAI